MASLSSRLSREALIVNSRENPSKCEDNYPAMRKLLLALLGLSGCGLTQSNQGFLPFQSRLSCEWKEGLQEIRNIVTFFG